MGRQQTRTAKVTQNNAGSGRSRGTTVAINADLLGSLMDRAGVTAEELATATGKSGSYVRQLRLAMRDKASFTWARRASTYLVDRIGDPHQVVLALLLGKGNGQGTH